MLDATNSTEERRNYLRTRFHGKWQYLFIESICNDMEVRGLLAGWSGSSGVSAGSVAENEPASCRSVWAGKWQELSTELCPSARAWGSRRFSGERRCRAGAVILSKVSGA